MIGCCGDYAGLASRLVDNLSISGLIYSIVGSYSSVLWLLQHVRHGVDKLRRIIDIARRRGIRDINGILGHISGVI